MPRLTVSMLEGRSVEIKRQLARRLVSAVSETLEVPPASVSIAFDEYKPENLVIGGVLACDRKKKEN